MGLVRLLLAIAVFNSHFPFLEMPVVDGHEAVLAFFAISGFYMALILDTDYGSPKEFYLGRFLSLYPIYLFALTVAVGLFVTWDIHPMAELADTRKLLSDPTALVAMVWTSACVLGQELLFSLAPSPGGGLHLVTESRSAIWENAPLIQAWSLSLEIMFYALAPFLVRLRSRSLAWLIAASLAAKIVIMASGASDVAPMKRFFPVEFWLFGAGILSYRMYARLKSTPRNTDVLFFCGLVAAVCSADLVPDWAEPFALPAATLVAMPPVFRLFQKSGLDRITGKISYPFYLLHFSVIAVFETYWDEPVGWHILAVTLSAALLTHHIFTPGILLLKSRMRAMKQPLFATEAPAAHESLTLKA